jgi:3-deoxy-D-manno-octulosonate 8-phosphate phosphatase KdsC-like HAD superfamily phosphatase
MQMNNELYIIVDIDGTITIPDHKREVLMHSCNTGRDKYYATTISELKREVLMHSCNTDWDKYYSTVWNDKKNYNVIKLVNDIISNTDIKPIFITGRSEVVRYETKELLVECFPFYPSANLILKMRDIGDNNPNWKVKEEIIQKMGLTPRNVVAVLDDEPDVVVMYKSRGFTVLQVQIERKMYISTIT